jgi:hypothetical protein
MSPQDLVMIGLTTLGITSVILGLIGLIIAAGSTR